MFARFMPKEAKFFDLFDAHAEQVLRGSQALVDMLSIRDDSDAEAERHSQAIDEIEQKAEEIARETMRQLHTSFITPIEREEIHTLVTILVEIINLTRETAHTVLLYNVNQCTAEAINLAKLGLACCERVKQAVALLHSMDNGPQILTLCHEIDRLESEADREMRKGMSKLFREEPDVRELIKNKAIYELLEKITDCCEDLADAIEGIVIQNS